MTQYIYIGGGLLVLAFVVGAVWFAYRSGKKAASVQNAATATSAADGVTEKALQMAQAEADKPTTEDALFKRLDEGTM